MRHTLLFLALIFVPTMAHAQVGEYRSQLAVGVNGGYTLNQIDFNPTIKQQWHGGPTMGLTVRYTCEKYFACICALQAELNYARLGWTELIETSDDTYQRHMNYIQLPVFARLAFGKEVGGFQGYLLLGPQLGFCLSESAELAGPWSQQSMATRPNGVIAQYELAMQNHFDYGIAGGLGAEFSTQSGHRIALEGRYYYGLGDIFSNSKKDVFGRSNHGTIYAKVAYIVDLFRKAK